MLYVVGSRFYVVVETSFAFIVNFYWLVHHMANCHDKKDVAIIAHHQTVNETLNLGK